MRVLAIGGVPGCGKTTLMRRFIERSAQSLGPWETFSAGLLRGIINRERKVVVLGVYEPGEVFAGTDKLSMAVSSDAKKFVADAAGFFDLPKGLGFDDCALIFEGDRLFNASFLSFCHARRYTRALVVDVSSEILSARRRARGTDQSPSWLVGRETKIRNIVDKLAPSGAIERWPNDTDRETEAIIGAVWQFAAFPQQAPDESASG